MNGDVVLATVFTGLLWVILITTILVFWKLEEFYEEAINSESRNPHYIYRIVEIKEYNYVGEFRKISYILQRKHKFFPLKWFELYVFGNLSDAVREKLRMEREDKKVSHKKKSRKISKDEIKMEIL